MAETMTTAMRHLPGAEVVAVSSSTLERAEAFAKNNGIPRAYGKFRDFLADPLVDIVYIANSSRFHADACEAALDSGKNVLCEKPFALSGSQARRVVDAAERSSKFFMEALWTLFLPAYERLLATASAATFGDPKYMRFEFGYPVHVDDLARLTAEEDGGILFDRGCYGVALAIKMFGEVQDISSLSSGATITLQLRHANGVQSHIAVSADALLSNTVAVGYSEGCAGLDAPAIGAESFWSAPIEIRKIGEGMESPIRRKLRQSTLARRIHRSLTEPRRVRLSYGEGPYLAMLQHVISRLDAGARSSEILPLSISTAAVTVLEQAKNQHERLV